MTHFSTYASAFVLLTAISSPVFAADIRGSAKDTEMKFFESPTGLATNRSGFYVNGSLGIAQGDRDIRGRINGERYDAEEIESEIEGEDSTWERGELNVNHMLPFGGSDDADSTVLGAGLSYMFHMPASRFAVELGLDGTLYTDNATTLNFSGNPIDRPGTDDEGVSRDLTTGSVKFQRDFDIDLVAKGHLFVTDRWSVYAGGGLSWAFASAKGGHSNTNVDRQSRELDPIYVNNYDDNDSAFGYVLIAGTQVWLTDRVTFGAEYSYKKHDFSFNNSSSALDLEASPEAIRDSSDSVDVDDEIHTIKAKLGFKLN